jgi:hypothetical protein
LANGTMYIRSWRDDRQHGIGKYNNTNE